jgi:glycosyltransferase involved in cell wall biosynthesis
MSMATLPISVVILAKDAESTIGECLSAVQQNNPAEIVVVDGISTDGTVEIAQRYSARTYSDEGKGKSYARQLGAEVAGQEYIAYVDSDVVLTEGALATMLAELQASDHIGIGAGEPPGVKSVTYWEWAQRQQAQLSHPRNRPASIGMAASLFRRETILNYGFELGYGGYLDDRDLEIRLRRDGHTFGLSSATIYHRHKADLRTFVGYRFLFGRLCVYHMRKHGPWHVGFWPPLFAAYWFAFCLVRGKWKLIPYHIVDGIVETAGIAKGVVELMGEWTVRKLEAFRRIRQ